MKIELSKMEFDWKTSILLFIISVSIFIKYLRKKTATNLPPGPPKLPILGNLHQLIRRNTVPHRRLAELAKLYGPIMHLRLGEVPTLVISSADLAAEVMKTHDAVFCSRPLLMVAKELFYGASDIGLAPYGEYWRQARKISVLELFTAKRVQSFRNIREEEAVELMNDLRSLGGCVVNLSKMMFGLTFNITTRIAFSKKGKEQDEFRAFTGAVTKASSGFSIADLYPSIEFLHSISGTKRKFKELVQESNRILDPIIDDHRANKRLGDQDQQHEDLVDVLLKFHKDNLKTHNNQEFSLSIDNMKAIILELFGAGVETSSTALEWAMSELLKNPNVMEKAQAEVRRVYQGKTTVDESMLNELKYMKHVIKETLRLHPPLPLLAPRESIESCRLHSYDIPSKTRVLINAWAIGRDPKYWSDPEKFDPERFEGSSIDYKGTDFELIPFGAGRRKCPGMTLGIVNVELPLAMLLYHFDWRLPHGVEGPQNLDMDESFGITIRRKNELYVIPVPYGH